MINPKEIIGRRYEQDGKEPVNFEYIIKGLDGPHGETQELRVWFEKVNPEKYGMMTNNPTYKIFTFIDSVVYEKIYQMPKSNMPLEMVVATGLNLLRFTFLEEVKYKEMLSYTIADITKDM